MHQTKRDFKSLTSQDTKTRGNDGMLVLKCFQKIKKNQRYKDSWNRWNASLEMLSKMKTRTVIRITLIKDYNFKDELIPEFAQMLRQASPHFIEVKSYMHIGRSTNRLEYSNMLEMSEVRHFASNLAKNSEIFSVMDESVMSRIVVLQNQNRFIDRWIHAYVNTN